MDSVVPAVVQSFMYNEMSGGGAGFINKSKSTSSVIQRKSVSYKEENIEVIDDRTFDGFLEKVMPSTRSASLIGAERQSDTSHNSLRSGGAERQSVTKTRLEGERQSVTKTRLEGERQSVTKRRRQTKSKSMKYVKKANINL